MDVGMLTKLQLLVNSDNDNICRFCIENAEDIVKNYCNVDSVPAGLINTVIRMAADIFRREQFGTTENPLAVASVTVGDTSTSYRDIQSAAGTGKEIIDNYAKQLNKYRRLT